MAPDAAKHNAVAIARCRYVTVPPGSYRPPSATVDLRISQAQRITFKTRWFILAYRQRRWGAKRRIRPWLLTKLLPRDGTRVRQARTVRIMIAVGAARCYHKISLTACGSLAKSQIMTADIDLVAMWQDFQLAQIQGRIGGAVQHLKLPKSLVVLDGQKLQATAAF